MVTIDDIQRRYDELDTIIEPIRVRAEERSEYVVWPMEAAAIIAAAGKPLPVGWGNESSYLGEIVAAAKALSKCGANHRQCFERIYRGFQNLSLAIDILLPREAEDAIAGTPNDQPPSV